MCASYLQYLKNLNILPVIFLDYYADDSPSLFKCTLNCIPWMFYFVLLKRSQKQHFSLPSPFMCQGRWEDPAHQEAVSSPKVRSLHSLDWSTPPALDLLGWSPLRRNPQRLSLHPGSLSLESSCWKAILPWLVDFLQNFSVNTK